MLVAQITAPGKDILISNLRIRLSLDAVSADRHRHRFVKRLTGSTSGRLLLARLARIGSAGLRTSNCERDLRAILTSLGGMTIETELAQARVWDPNTEDIARGRIPGQASSGCLGARATLGVTD